MEITVWGSRGSAPVSSADSSIYGGNTTCVEVLGGDGARLIIDAGTGIRNLGEKLRQKGEKGRCTILFTHTHWDHIQGFSFFKQLYYPDWEINIKGPAWTMPINLSLEYMLNGIHFPLHLSEIPSKVSFTDLHGGESFQLGDMLVETCPTRHPGGGIACKVSADGWSFVFTGDHEHHAPGENDPLCLELERFIRGVDVLLADGQYLSEEYQAYKGWGHSSQAIWLPLCGSLNIKRVILTHHDPRRNDRSLREAHEGLKEQFKNLNVDMAFDGLQIKDNISQISHSPFHDAHYFNVGWVHEVNKYISQFSDIDMINDAILEEARGASRAEAGTLYLVEGDDLVFAYTQNDKLFPGSAGIKHLYHNLRIPINPDSIAGYAAVSKQNLLLDDVRSLPPGMPFTFNDSWDRQSGYNTVSMLVMPLLRGDKLLGVLQLINALDYRNNYAPFNLEAQNRMKYLNEIAVNALERGIMARELIVRMLRLSQLRDPMETSDHVHRVGAMAAELYHYWAERQNESPYKLKLMKDRIRLAAMLHDIGKVGIPDDILKKPGRLTSEERVVMEHHCYLGAMVFSNITWDVDDMAKIIAQHHHQKWDGSGYTGHDSAVPTLARDAIPLCARITAIADVYDALRSRRCYKEPMSFAMSVAIMQKDAGSHFDPELVTIFLENIGVMEAILERFQNHEDEIIMKYPG